MTHPDSNLSSDVEQARLQKEKEREFLSPEQREQHKLINRLSHAKERESRSEAKIELY
jgi:hypothetical protein